MFVRDRRLGGAGNLLYASLAEQCDNIGFNYEQLLNWYGRYVQDQFTTLQGGYTYGISQIPWH